MAKFDYFVVFAEMRTGSNFLEANINSFDGLKCHGEAFNPHFIGYPNSPDLLGVTQSQRDSDPKRVINAIRADTELGGFRFFNDHDSRVLDIVLPDPRCAKIILTRNPVESYVSWRIAAATGQWKLTNVKHAKTEQVRFRPAEFEDHLETLQAFQVKLLNALQKTGQTAFYVAYEDLQDIEVMNGMAAFLGSAARIDSLDKKLKKQNPEPIEDKVSNFAEMEKTLARLDRFNLTRTPNFEPRRGPAIPTIIAAPKSPLLYLPIRSGPELAVRDWMIALDGGALVEGFGQKTLRDWKSARPGHRSFTVLRHPVARAHAAFCDKILDTGPGTFTEIRENLRKSFHVPLPAGAPGPDYDDTAHRAAFLAFLKFLKSNLAGQTNLRVDPAWASQTAILQGFAGFVTPDLILREATLAQDLVILSGQIGLLHAPVIGPTDPHAERLSRIYDADVETATRDAYSRDYMAFGFTDWA
jgi:LPS sulfotransferase NodH